MASEASSGQPSGRLWRIMGWGVAAGLLLTPAIAMQFTEEVDWNAADFIIMGLLIGSVGVVTELGVRSSASIAYRAGVALAAVTAFLLIWINLAVGIIGSEDNPANAMYLFVLSIPIVSAIVAKRAPEGLSRGMFTTAAAQIAVGAIALLEKAGEGSARWPLDVLFLSAFFAGLWLFSGWLFHRSAVEAR